MFSPREKKFSPLEHTSKRLPLLLLSMRVRRALRSCLLRRRSLSLNNQLGLLRKVGRIANALICLLRTLHKSLLLAPSQFVRLRSLRSRELQSNSEHLCKLTSPSNFKPLNFQMWRDPRHYQCASIYDFPIVWIDGLSVDRAQIGCGFSVDRSWIDPHGLITNLALTCHGETLDRTQDWIEPGSSQELAWT